MTGFDPCANAAVFVDADPWAPLLLADGRRLEPAGLRSTDIDEERVWIWREVADNGLRAAVSPRGMLTVGYPDCDPSDSDCTLVIEAIHLDIRQLQPGPKAPHVRHFIMNTGGRPVRLSGSQSL